MFLSLFFFTLTMLFIVLGYIYDELIYLIPVFIFFIATIICLIFVYNDKAYKINQNWHYNGEIMVLKDTVIVIQANKLNKLYRELNPTDSLHEVNIIEQCSIPLNNRVLFYDKKEYQLNNKTDNLSVLITKDTIFINSQ